MNNLRLLTGLLSVALSSGGACLYGQSVMTLEEIFEAAEANSAQLRPSRTAQAEAVQGISVARAERLPGISASLALNYIGNGFTTKRDFGDHQKAPIPHFGNRIALSVEQPVYTGGAVSRGVELAELQSTAARYATEFQRDNIRFRLTGFYLDIYKYTNLRQVVEKNLEAAREVLREMQARHSQGTALRNDMTRYELLVADLELQRTSIGNTIDILNDNLVTTAGLPAGTVVVPDTAILTRSLPDAGAARWQQEAVTNAPSLSLARSNVEISRKNEDLVRAARRPKVGLQAGWNLEGPILVEVPPINRNLSYWYVGVGLNYNLSSLYKSRRALAKSHAATLKAEAELDAARQDIELAVRDGHTRYLEACDRLQSLQKSVELAERNYHTTATRYAAGMALVTDMLDAANARLDAGQRLVNARIDIIYNHYKLLFISGKI